MYSPTTILAVHLRIGRMVEVMENYDETLSWKDSVIDDLRSRAKALEMEKARADAAEARVATLVGAISFYSAEVSARDSAMFAMRETIKEKDDRIEKLEAKNAEWEQKARGWLATPEAAKRLDGYREMTARIVELESVISRILTEEDPDGLRVRFDDARQALAGRKEG